MEWPNGKWIQFSYINHLGYECGHYAFIQSLEEFKEIIERYKIKFENVLDFSIDGRECKVHQVKKWFSV